jgi:hypothetical protein
LKAGRAFADVSRTVIVIDFEWHANPRQATVLSGACPAICGKAPMHVFRRKTLAAAGSVVQSIGEKATTNSEMPYNQRHATTGETMAQTAD